VKNEYGFIPAISLELLFRLAGTPVPARWNSCSGSLELLFQSAGIHVFLILDFQDQ